MTTNPKLNEPRSGGAFTTTGRGSADMVDRALDDWELHSSSALQENLEKEQLTLPFQIALAQEFYSDELWQAMEHRNLSQVEFAKKAEVSKQFLTKVFHGGNCTIETMVRLAYALDHKVNIHLTPNEVGCAWLHRMDAIPSRHPKHFSNPWAESGYKPIVVIEKEFDCEKITAKS